MKRTRNIKISVVAGLIILFSLFGIQAVSAQTVWLDQLDLSTTTQGYGMPMSNKSVEGKTLTIAGKTFERGFGTHAESSLLILLEGKALSFTAQVGIDDEVADHEPAAEFVVYGDNQKLWSRHCQNLFCKA